MLIATENMMMELKKSVSAQQPLNDGRTLKNDAIDLSELTSELQRSLEIQPLLEAFNRYVSHTLSQSGFSYENMESNNIIKGGSRSHHSCSYTLTLEGSYLGEISFMRRTRFSEADLFTLESALGVLVYPLRNSLLYQSAVRSSLTDHLTGALNRSTLNTSLNQEIARAKRLNTDVSVLTLDLDFFKKVNDKFGHAAGDQVLIAVTNCIKLTVREVDPTFRIGGEEFVVILSGSHAEGAKLLADRLRNKIAALTIRTSAEAEPFSVTASIGVATYLKNEKTDELLKRSDQALYQAKNKGRNRVISAA